MSNPTTIEEYCDQLNHIMDKHDLNFKEMSQLSGISATTIAGIVSGKTKIIRGITVRRLEHFFKKPIEEIDTTTSKEIGTKLEGELNNIFKNAKAKVLEIRDYYYQIELETSAQTYDIHWGVMVRDRVENEQAIRNEAEAICRALIQKIEKEARTCKKAIRC